MGIKFTIPGSLDKQRGSFTLEVLVGLVLLAIMGMGLARSTITSLRTREFATRSSLATQVATETLEAFSATNPADLNDADDLTDTVTRQGIQFAREVNVTVNADQSRTIEVSIAAVVAELGGRANLSVRVLPWGSV